MRARTTQQFKPMELLPPAEQAKAREEMLRWLESNKDHPPYPYLVVTSIRIDEHWHRPLAHFICHGQAVGDASEGDHIPGMGGWKVKKIDGKLVVIEDEDTNWVVNLDAKPNPSTQPATTQPAK